VSRPFLLLFLQKGGKLHVLFQCLEHARADDLSRSPVWHTPFHPPDQVPERSREFRAALGGQDEAGNHAGNRAAK